MNPVQQMTKDTSRAGCVLHLTLRKGEAGVLPNDPGKLTQRLMEEISLRATMVGPVLESILLEAHEQPRWGVKE